MIGPKIFAALIGIAAAAAIAFALVAAGGSIMTTVKQARDGEWYHRLTAANDAAEIAQREINEKAEAAAAALRKQQAAEESLEHVLARNTALQKLIAELKDDPICIPAHIVEELRK